MSFSAHLMGILSQPRNSFPSATGGNSIYDITVGSDIYRVHEFTSNGTFTVVDEGTFEYLVIGEGASGGEGRGGGAGGDATNYGSAGGGGGRTQASGGTSNNGGNGYQGIVIVRYKIGVV